MRSSYGSSTPWFWESEQEVYDLYKKELLAADVVHDYSHTKRVAEDLYGFDQRTNVVNTLYGSVWSHPKPPFNLVLWSEAMKQRGLKGLGDYHGSPWERVLASNTGSIKDAHVVPGCTDTDLYAFEPDKGDYYLWFSRFHPSKGYHIAIQLAKLMKIPLVLMGDHPDVAPSPDHRAGALEAIELARGADNIKFRWLKPGDNRALDKVRIIQKAKALLYTIQFQECFGLVTVEALSCGTPVIATNFGSMPEIIDHGKTGFVCNDMPDLVTAVQDVGRIRPEECRRQAVARFDRRVYAQNYLKEYRLAMNGPPWGL